LGKVDLNLSSVASASSTKADEVIGCPSGLQEQPISLEDPYAEQLDLTPYVSSQSDNSYQIDLIVKGAHCGGCLSKIEKGLSELEPVSQARMNLSTLRLRVAWAGEREFVNTVVERLSNLGFGAAPYDVSESSAQKQSETRTLLLAMAVAGFAAMNVMLLSIAVWSGGEDMSVQTHTLFHWISAAIALPTVIYSGRVFFKSAWSALKERQTNMDVPISLALILASGLSLYETIKGNPDTYFDAAVMLLFLLLIGRYLDARLRFQTGEAARRLAALQVTSATLILSDGSIKTVPARDVMPGNKLLIPAGQKLAVDCVIETGTSEIDMQIATGETKLQSFGPGDTLFSGTTNLGAPLTVKAIAKYSDSFLSEITELVEMGQQKKGRFVRIADKAAKAYVPVVHSVAALTFIGWYIFGGDLRQSTLNAIAVLIITCPCALGLAVPAVQIVASGRLFKQGILLKSGDALERLAKVRHVIFDKTGTLTQGRFSLENEKSITPNNLAIIGSLAKFSSHPLSRALSAYAKDLHLESVQEFAGQGISASFEGKTIKLGSASFLNMDFPETSNTQIGFSIEGEVPLSLHMQDTVRPDTVDSLKSLQSQGLSYEMLSGDSASVAKDIANQLGIENYKAKVSPRQKMSYIQQRMKNGDFPLMVGDGINDAPALAEAYCSMSLAGAADISRASADIILQDDKLSSLPLAIDTARQAHKRIVENLTLAVCYNFIAIPLAVAGLVNPLIAAIAMSGSSLLVTLNALRMAKLEA